ncbi:RimJ/RimL family protein N-acetyltransferase [Enterococcus sp. PF1-24]|uniref:GNAT family N-acetyltransferase n=1 Tax=unclassified Enterococcus TaxID=2608891 RepID=UPI002474D73A|nr:MULTISPECIES: GNAT family N-acetyltransferase [unclassified Enterococcus]MDH6364476.1 RimJ/RimL family protein N-acetyltransferase [Enterococcus sp. PFB1-1]MDH6401501.1 RimJ/RimL family protein N-acetyltransferase [Enterococcus sp. PF1-24]
MLTLRLMKDDDISLVAAWLNKEHVKKWYEIPHLNVTIDDWLYEINHRYDEFQWLTHLIVMWGDTPIGLCQYYNCQDSGEEDFGTLPLAGSYGIDYLIGEEDYLGKGLGKALISLLVDKIFSFPDAQRVTADIDKANQASEKSLLACGFVLIDGEDSRFVKTKNSFQ